MKVWNFILQAARGIDLRDVFVFGGLLLATYGIYGFIPSAAWIFLGLMLFLLGMKR